MKPPAKILSSELLSSKRYKLYQFTYETTDRTGIRVIQSREVYDRGNGAVILLYNPHLKTVILTRQFRLPTFVNGNLSGLMIEACAGLLDADSPEDCIRRETEEETGYRIKEVRKIFEAYMSPGAVTEILHFFVAEYAPDQKVAKGGGVDEDENIDVLEIEFSTALHLMETGEIKDAKTIMLLQYAQLNSLITSR